MVLAKSSDHDFPWSSNHVTQFSLSPKGPSSARPQYVPRSYRVPPPLPPFPTAPFHQLSSLPDPPQLPFVSTVPGTNPSRQLTCLWTFCTINTFSRLSQLFHLPKFPPYVTPTPPSRSQSVFMISAHPHAVRFPSAYSPIPPPTCLPELMCHEADPPPLGPQLVPLFFHPYGNFQLHKSLYRHRFVRDASTTLHLLCLVSPSSQFIEFVEGPV